MGEKTFVKICPRGEQILQCVMYLRLLDHIEIPDPFWNIFVPFAEIAAL